MAFQYLKSVFIVAVILVSLPIQAAIVDSTDVTINSNSYGTFLDETTGLTWLDIDSFWDSTSTYNSIVSELSGSGFHLASLDEVRVVQDEIISAATINFTDLSTIVGGNYYGNPHPGDDRDLIWGIYADDSETPQTTYTSNGYVWGYFSSPSFGHDTPLYDVNNVQQDLGAWIVSDTPLFGAVPIPSAVWLFGSGLLGFIGVARRRSI